MPHDYRRNRHLKAISEVLCEVSSIGWSELLKLRRVVILGEAGSGKTWEIRHRCQTQRKCGAAAFYFELERLIYSEPLQVLAPSDRRDFQDWLAGTESGFLFLDSVDEAKLRRQIDFHRAPRKPQAIA